MKISRSFRMIMAAVILLAAVTACSPKPARVNAEATYPICLEPKPAAAEPSNGNGVSQSLPGTSTSLGTESMLSEISKEVAGKVYYELRAEGEGTLGSRIAVVSAVPLSDLKKDTEFGRVLAEYLLTDLADRGLKVAELRLGKDINILPKTGEFILSRNIGELASDMPELSFVMLSTFTNTRRTLIVQGRLVDLKSGLVKSSWRYDLPLNRELLGFFQVAHEPHTIAVKGIPK